MNIKFPNGSQKWPIVQTYRYIRNPYEYLQKCRQQYGDIFTIDLMNFPKTIFIGNQEHNNAIFKDNGTLFNAGEPNAKLLESFLGKNSVLTLDGEKHKRERKLIAPTLHKKTMMQYGETIVEITNQHLSQCSDSFKMLPVLRSLTLDVILKIVFGFKDDGLFDDIKFEFTKLFQQSTGKTISLLLGLFPFLLAHPPKRIAKQMQRIDELLYKQIKIKRQKAESNDNDILAILLKAKDENGEALTDIELRDELITLLSAGHDTTATTIAWVLHHVYSKPEILNKIEEELDQHVDKGLSVSAEIATQLTYLDAVIKESARLTPAVPFVVRKSKQAYTLDDYQLPKNAVLAPCIYLANTNPNDWDNPQLFKPERFIDTKINPYTYFPFGGGIRRCIGMGLADFEIKLVLAQIFNCHDFSLASSYKRKVERRGIVFSPSDDLPVSV